MLKHNVSIVSQKTIQFRFL